MIRPRWRKVIADFSINLARSTLVVLSIAVGLFAIGMITTVYVISSADMRGGYAKTNPSNITLSISAFDDELVKRVERLDGVAQAQGVRSFSLRIQDANGQWKPINIKSLPGEQSINLPAIQGGVWPPPERQIAIDQYKLPRLGVSLGSQVTLELPSGRQRSLMLAAVTKDQTIGASGLGGGFFVAPIQGYVAEETLAWLGQPSTYNTLAVTVAEKNTDMVHIQQVAGAVKDQVEASGYIVYTSVLGSSDDHPNSTYVNAISSILFILGFLIVFLSGFLITNTLSALLNQQIQQIGIMKTLGARRAQIVVLYMVLILFYGLLALAISLPLSNRASFVLMDYLSNQINYEVQGFRLVKETILLLAFIALVVPQAAGFFPILRGTRITIQRAIQPVQVDEHRPRRLIAVPRRIPRPLLLSLRNTFRQKVRLALTLITLSLGGAIFISTFNVEASLSNHIDRLGKYFMADVNLDLDKAYRVEQVRSALSSLPGVGYVEGWALWAGEIVFADGSSGENVHLIAPPVESRLIEPLLLEGRWLQPGDTDAIVLNENFKSRFPDLHPGDSIRLKVYGRESNWVIVGFFQMAGKSGGYLAYTTYDTLSREIHRQGSATSFRIRADRPNLTLAEQQSFAAQIEEYMRSKGFRVSEASAGQSLLENTTDGLNTLTNFLLIMALLTALVGSIGLTGTMSLNVMERTREIGVLRAIGASDGAIMQMVLVEGMLIGSISWVLGALLAFPISRVMTDSVSQAIFDAPMAYRFVPSGFLIWLGVVVLLSIFASLLPARKAARLTIREILSYE